MFPNSTFYCTVAIHLHRELSMRHLFCFVPTPMHQMLLPLLFKPKCSVAEPSLFCSAWLRLHNTGLRSLFFTDDLLICIVEELEPEAFQIIAPMEFVVNAAIFLGMQIIISGVSTSCKMYKLYTELYCGLQLNLIRTSSYC